MNIIE